MLVKTGFPDRRRSFRYVRDADFQKSTIGLVELRQIGERPISPQCNHTSSFGPPRNGTCGRAKSSLIPLRTMGPHEPQEPTP